MSDGSKKIGGKEPDKPMETVKTTAIPTKSEYAEGESKKNSEKRKGK